MAKKEEKKEKKQIDTPIIDLGDREMGKEWLDEKYLGRVYCKKCKKEGSLVAEMETAGNNLHIDFIVQHDDQRGTIHFVGRKIFKSLKGIEEKEARGESFGG